MLFSEFADTDFNTMRRAIGLIGTEFHASSACLVRTGALKRFEKNLNQSYSPNRTLAKHFAVKLVAAICMPTSLIVEFNFNAPIYELMFAVGLVFVRIARASTLVKPLKPNDKDGKFADFDTRLMAA